MNRHSFMQLAISLRNYKFKNWQQYIEPVFLTLLWGTYFLSINVNWTGAWIAKSFLPEYVAPHYAIAFPAIFFINTFWLIPKYLNKNKWHVHFLIAFGLFVTFEFLRALIFSWFLPSQSFIEELTGENGLALGKLNFITTNAIFWSYCYRFTRDWFFNQALIHKLTSENNLLTSNHKPEISSFKQTFTIKKRGANIVLKIDDIVYFKAEGDFVLAIDSNERKHIINKRLKQVYDDLDPCTFFQINRSEIINFSYFNRYKPYIKNRLEVFLESTDKTLYTSNSRTPEFRLWVNQH